MVKLKSVVLGLILSGISCTAVAQSLVQINFDKETVAAVSANIAAEEVFLQGQNAIVDSIRMKQNKLAELLKEMATYKTLIMKTYQNTQGFRQEAGYYTRIVNLGIDVISNSVEAYKELDKAKIAGKINASLKVASLVTDAVSLGQTFADIVANGKVENPLKKAGGAKNPKGDGHNLLNRHERLKLANDIVYQLRRINSDLRLIAWRARTSTIKDVVIALDRKGFANACIAKWEINSILRKWDKLSRK